MSHFYERNSAGEIVPRHFVPMASRPGELRPTRITDARKHGWYASVTTIQGMLDKPGLNDWRVTEHLKQAYEAVAYGELTPQVLREMGEEEYIKRVKGWTQEQLDKAPQQGTDFHDILEKYFSDGADIEWLSKEDRYTCAMVDELLTKTCGKQEWITEKSFVHDMGFAGKCDIHSPEWVIDYKTKNDATKWKPGKMAYSEMCQQLAAYRVGLGLHNARCANVFVCIPTGEVEFHEWGQEELDREFANFTDLLRIWLRNAMYVPGSVK